MTPGGVRRGARKVADGTAAALPGSLLKKLTDVGAPLTRWSGYSTASVAVLRAALTMLAQPPKRLWPISGTVSIADIAERLGQDSEVVRRWAGHGLLGEPAQGPSTTGEVEARWDEAAVERATLIDLAVRRGTSETTLGRAARDGMLGVLALESALAMPGDLTPAEVASRGGVPLERVHAVWQALGFAPPDTDQRQFGRHEVQAMRVLHALEAVFTEDDLLEATSVVGRAMSEVATAYVQLFLRRLRGPFVDAGAGDIEMVLRLAAMQELLVPTVAPLLEVALRRHLEAAVRGAVAVEMEHFDDARSGQRLLAVAFADLVGFTAATETMTALDVAGLAATLLRCAERTVPRHGGRIIKSIGDAVMFTTPDPISCVLAAIGLVDELAAHPAMPPVRVGVCHGPVLPAYADLFGRTVNLASRLCTTANPGEVIVYMIDRPVRPDEWAASGVHASPVTLDELKGVSGPLEAWRVTRARMEQ